MEIINNPHDKYFRSAMSNLQVARNFLEAYLPKKIIEQIEWSSLRQEKNDHIDKDLLESMTDLLYQVRLGKNDGYLSILVEHQSSVERMMPFRVLKYIINIMDAYLKKHPKADMPLVIPLVFYSGERPYHASTDIFTLFGQQESLARETFLKPFRLIDLGRISDEVLKNHMHAALMELVQKYIRSKNFMVILKSLVPWLKKALKEANEDYFYSTLRYICSTAELEDPKAFAKIIEHEVYSSKEHCGVTTLAQIWHEEGRQEGWQTGLEKARQDVVATKQEIARQLLKEGQSMELITRVTGLSIEEFAKI